MDLEGLGTFKEHEGQPLIHLIHVQEEPNSLPSGIDSSYFSQGSRIGFSITLPLRRVMIDLT